MKKAFVMATLLGSLLISACSAFGIRSGTEEPRFTAIERLGNVEIRRYAPRLAAETTVSGDAYHARGEGFRRLAGYIFGANAGRRRIDMTAPVAQSSAQSGERIAMTAPVAQAPVTQASGEGGWVIRFYLPSALTGPPAPNDARVRVAPVPEETVAVLRFSGTATADAVADRTKALTAALSGSPWHASGEPVAWFYDPPWTLPPLRRNEVAVPVTR